MIDENNISFCIDQDPTLFGDTIHIIGKVTEDLLTLSFLNIHNIATAAVKELNAKVETLESIIQQQQREIDLIKSILLPNL